MRIARSILSELSGYAEALLGAVPGRAGVWLRRAYWGARMQALGAGAMIGTGTLVIGAGNIRIGDEFSCWRNCTLAAGSDGVITLGRHVGLNANVYLNAASGGRITIGDEVGIGPNVVMRAANKNMSPERPMTRQANVGLTITVGTDVWIGANVVVVGGVTIGDGAVVAAGAVVTRDVAPGTVVAGVPARFVKHRGPEWP